jgi:hypothetical protein
MRGWPLYLSILGGAVLLALALKSVPPGVIIIVGLVCVAVASMQIRRAAKAGGDAVAAVGLGFDRSPTDPFSLRALPLGLFARGSDQAIADVMWGNWGELEVKLFTFGYTDAAGTRRSFSCALAQSPSHDLAMVVEPTSFLTPEPDRAPMPVVTIHDPAFAVEFEVRSDDPARAAEALDEGLRERLRSLQDRWAFELRDRMLLCYSPVTGVDPMESLGTLSLLRRAFGAPALARPGDEMGTQGPSQTAET